METTATTDERSASSESQWMERTDVEIASAALLQMASSPQSRDSPDLPNREEMLRIISRYGPETSPPDLDLRDVKPDECHVQYIFKALNPTFAKRFYRTCDGKWVPHLGEHKERRYRLDNAICCTPRKRRIPILVLPRKGQRLRKSKGNS
jgi:hypothetical protein